MIYVTDYDSPLGEIYMAADEEGLIGLWIEGQEHFAKLLDDFEDKVLRVDSSTLFKNNSTPATCKKILCMTKEWLDVYFTGREPDFTPPIHMIGTDFRKSVWKILLEIPYGKTITYGEIARRLVSDSDAGAADDGNRNGDGGGNGDGDDKVTDVSRSGDPKDNSSRYPQNNTIKMPKRNKPGKRMSAQAVGGAVGHNPISIIIPCHRVIGANGNLTGYAGGIDKKIWLLELERTALASR